MKVEVRIKVFKDKTWDAFGQRSLTVEADPEFVKDAVSRLSGSIQTAINGCIAEVEAETEKDTDDAK